MIEALTMGPTTLSNIINTLPDLHDTNGNTIPKMVEYGSYTTSATPPHRAHHMPGFPWLPIPCL